MGCVVFFLAGSMPCTTGTGLSTGISAMLGRGRIVPTLWRTPFWWATAPSKWEASSRWTRVLFASSIRGQILARGKGCAKGQWVSMRSMYERLDAFNVSYTLRFRCSCNHPRGVLAFATCCFISVIHDIQWRARTAFVCVCRLTFHGCSHKTLKTHQSLISLSGHVQHYKRMLQRQSQPAEVKTEARFVLAGSVCQVSPPTHKETVEPFVSLQTGLGLGHPPLMLTREGAPQLTACI